MPNVVTIAKDSRLRKLAEQYLQETGIESLRLASFESFDEFAALYFRDKSKVAEEEGKVETSAEETDLRLFSEVNLLLFALDSVGHEKPKPFLDKVPTLLKQFKQLPKDSPFQMVMMKYEDDGIAKLDLMHPALTDILYLPLDRLIFLQKLEIFLNLPKRVKTSFLFNQEVKHQIEISKLAKIDRFSDVGLAIRNPVPLKIGLPGHFFITLPGDKNALEIYGKVFRNEPHPDLPGQYLTYFGYFGLSKADLSAIRRNLAKASHYQSLHNENRSQFRFDYTAVFTNEGAARNQHLVIVDGNARGARELAAQTTKEIGALDVGSEASYSVFLHNYLSAENAAAAYEKPSPTEASDFYQSEIRLRVSSPDGRMLSLENPPAPGELFLGRMAEEVFASPEKWLELISSKETKLLIEECLALALADNQSERVLTLRDQALTTRAVLASFKKVAGEDGVSLRLRPASQDEITLHHGDRPQHRGLEALLIDTRFVPEDVAAWTTGLKNQAVQLDLARPESPTKFFLMSDSDRPMKAAWRDNPDVAGLFLKPVDMRQFLFLLSESLQNKTTVYNFENLGWSSPGITLHLAKEIEMDAVGEFGATLKSRQPLKPGTVVYLRGSIFNNAPNACLAARVYACEEHASDDGAYSIYVTYFGINDSFLKFVRAWIRENYATSKGHAD